MSLSNEQILEAIAGKTLLEVMELVKAMEEKFGVTAAAPVAVVAAGPAAAAAPVEEQTEFTVVLADAGANKVNVDQGGPRHHRPGPEGSQGPGRIALRHRQGRRVSKDDAAKFKKELEDAGAKVEIK
jgi:large subunit ribosomal protein L7/L12